MIDLLFVNGNILTMDGNNSKASSVAVRNGEIVGIWDTANPPQNATATTNETKVIDLKGKTLLPGFIDTHNHILMYGQLKELVNCSTPPNKTITHIIEAIRRKADDTPAGSWIQGYGYDDTLLQEQRHPTKYDLDEATPNHPMFIRHISGHLAVANSLALEQAGLSDDTQDPASGHYGRDNEGKLNGVIYESLPMEPITKLLPQLSQEEMIQALENASVDYLSEGITTNSDAKVGTLEELNAHLTAARNGNNPMRAKLMVMHDLVRDGAPFEGYDAEELNTYIVKKSKGKANLDSIKMFQDGSIQGLTGALRKPYYKSAKITGDFFHDQSDFQEEVLNLHERGFRITIHGNGDRAIGSILDAFEYALKHDPRDDHRHRIEHVQTATPEDLNKMKTLGVAGSFFINHVYYWGDRHKNIFLGPERARRISPLAEALDLNLLFTLHSDCPVTPISPLFSVWAAVNRLTSSGQVLGKEQRIDVMTALKAMTIYGAELNFDEKNSGSIELGKTADFTILDLDPVSIAPELIKDINVLSTIINGEIVWEA